MKEALAYAYSASAANSPAPSAASSAVNLAALSPAADASDASTGLTADTAGASTGTDKLDMNGLNRVNVLFSGCSFVTVDGMNGADFNKTESKGGKGDKTQTPSASGANTPTIGGVGSIPVAPDGGALAYVLRTGFGSSQGSLLQMIEFSQQTVAGTVGNCSFLFCFILLCNSVGICDVIMKFCF